MKKSTVVAAAATLAIAVGGLTTSAVAAAGGGSNDGGHADKASARGVGGAAAPNARIAAFVQAGGSVVRSKGVAGVGHPSTGLYCINPNFTLNVNKAIPLLSVDWSTSSGDALMAQWRSAGVGCPAGRFAVLTFDGEDGSFDLSDAVSFTFVVP